MKTKTFILFFSVLLGLSYTSLSQTRSATIATDVGTICYNTVPPANFNIAIGALCNGFSANRNGTHWKKALMVSLLGWNAHIQSILVVFGRKAKLLPLLLNTECIHILLPVVLCTQT